MPAVVSRDLLLLADELEALMRAGVPLGGGLRSASRNWRGGLRAAAERLGARLDSGVPLEEALQDQEDIPPLFAAIVTAGLKSDRTAEVLADFSDSTRRLLSLRETLLRSLMYPAILLMLCFGLFIGLLLVLLPALAGTFESFRLTAPAWLGPAEALAATIHLWGWTLPLAAAVVGAWLVADPTRLLNLPGIAGIQRQLQLANASELLAVLIDSRTPLPLSLRLTASCLTSPALRAALNRVEEHLSRGGDAAAALAREATIPPVWRSLFVASGRDSQRLSEGLRSAAELYRRRAATRAAFAGRLVPTVLVSVVGGGTAFLYASSVFVPMADLWRQLGSPQP
ncbi:MAG: type II secretion system F family protein [Planctomyces sp.]|nr:type II secretion system F family protein [Planctomyces sp.]